MIETLMKNNSNIKLSRGKIELCFKNGFYTVENMANSKNRTVVQSQSFEAALSAFLGEGL